MKIKLLIILSILSTIFGSDFRIEMLNERNYPMKRSGDLYEIEISPTHQTIFKMKAHIPSNKMERITWSINKKYRWSDGITTDSYPLVNGTSYST